MKYYILVIKVLASMTSTFRHRENDRAMRFKTNTPTPTPKRRHGNREVDELSKVDHVVTSAKLSHFEAKLFIFEDNEAVIKLIIKGRSPTTRHVQNPQSRT